MRSVDTNVVVRLLVKDDEAQARLAEVTWNDLLTSGGAFLSTVVLVEVSWVVRVSYGFDRSTTAQALRRLVDLEGVVVEPEPTLLRALDLFERGTADFSDYVILESSREARALPVLTFDQRFAREADVRLMHPHR